MRHQNISKFCKIHMVGKLIKIPRSTYRAIGMSQGTSKGYLVCCPTWPCFPYSCPSVYILLAFAPLRFPNGASARKGSSHRVNGSRWVVDHICILTGGTSRWRPWTFQRWQCVMFTPTSLVCSLFYHFINPHVALLV